MSLAPSVWIPRETEKLQIEVIHSSFLPNTISADTHSFTLNTKEILYQVKSKFQHHTVLFEMTISHSYNKLTPGHIQKGFFVVDFFVFIKEYEINAIF